MSQPAHASAKGGGSFHSQPGLHPPAVNLTGDPDSGPGDIFLTPTSRFQTRSPIQSGPMILNSRGQLLWFRNVGADYAANLEVQRYHGRPVLTWWQGTKNLQVGEDVIADSRYRTLAVLHASPGYVTNPHELQITPQGTALITATRTVRANLTGVGGPAKGYADDDTVQELDIQTGRLLWEWQSYRHVPLSASYARPYGPPFDYFHLNSIQQLPNGNLLISARHTWAIYEISKATGRIIWTLGGKHSSFKVAADARFSWQHDARLAGSTLRLFDDASDGPRRQEAQSSVKLLRLHMHTKRATLIVRYTHSPALVSVSQGNAQRLANGNLFVGWGSAPEFSEYTPAGHQIFSGALPFWAQSYRAYRFRWAARPATPPALDVTATSSGAVTLYASWNGATGVASWRVLAGPTPGVLLPVGSAVRSGFETAIRLKSAASYFAVQAVGGKGGVLGTSAAHAR